MPLVLLWWELLRLLWGLLWLLGTAVAAAGVDVIGKRFLGDLLPIRVQLVDSGRPASGRQVACGSWTLAGRWSSDGPAIAGRCVGDL